MIPVANLRVCKGSGGFHAEQGKGRKERTGSWKVCSREASSVGRIHLAYAGFRIILVAGAGGKYTSTRITRLFTEEIAALNFANKPGAWLRGLLYLAAGRVRATQTESQNS